MTVHVLQTQLPEVSPADRGGSLGKRDYFRYQKVFTALMKLTWYKGILASLKMEEHSAMCYDTDDP